MAGLRTRTPEVKKGKRAKGNYWSRTHRNPMPPSVPPGAPLSRFDAGGPASPRETAMPLSSVAETGTGASPIPDRKSRPSKTSPLGLGIASREHPMISLRHFRSNQARSSLSQAYTLARPRTKARKELGAAFDMSEPSTCRPQFPPLFGPAYRPAQEKSPDCCGTLRLQSARRILTEQLPRCPERA